MPRMRDDSRNGERMVALFLLGMVLFNPLLVDIFDTGAIGSLLGIPTLFLYLFACWAALIGLVAVVAESAPKDPISPPQHQRPFTENERGL